MTGLFSLATALIARGKKKDGAEQALTFETVYDTHFGFVWRTLRGLGVAEPLIDDAAQEVFLIVYRKFDCITEPEGVKSWIFSIARRVASDHRRSQKRKGVSVEYDDTVTTDTNTTPLQQVENRQVLARVERFMDQLSDNNRSIFVLSEIEQLPISKVSQIVGINSNTIYSRLKVIRLDLEKFLARYKTGPKEGCK